jgi:tetratricopeptide (TPR) repeat protein
VNGDASPLAVPLFASADYGKTPAKPGTHVFVIGVGHYPHLPGGGGKPANETLSLKQLTSPPISAKALADWFLATASGASPTLDGFRNPTAPLASLWMLVSAKEQTYSLPDGKEVTLLRADLNNIQVVYEAWMNAVSSHPDNIGVFYFCGHGVQGVNSYLLPDDFGMYANPWNKAFDIDLSAMAARQRVAASLYFFIDACRQMQMGAEGSRPQSFGLPKDNAKVLCRTRLKLWATGDGAKAFASGEGVPSRFTDALLRALNGSYGQLTEVGGSWVVTGEALAHQVVRLVEESNPLGDSEHFQRAEVQIIGSQPFQYLDSKPTVDGGIASTWMANVAIREEIARLVGSAPLPFVVLERFAEKFESQMLKIDSLQAELEADRKDYESNIAFLNGQPDSALVRKTKELNEAGEFQLAGLVLDEIVALTEAQNDIKLGEAYVARGDNWRLQGKHEEALATYQKAYELLPTEPRFALPYGETLEIFQRYDEAWKTYVKLVDHLTELSIPQQETLAPLIAQAHQRLGFLYYKKQKTPKGMEYSIRNLKRAVSIFERLARGEPRLYGADLMDALSALGVVLNQTGSYRKAEAAFRLSVCIARKLASDGNPKFSRNLIGCLANLCVARRSGNRLSEAETALKEASALIEAADKKHEAFLTLRLVVAQARATLLMQYEPPRFEEAEKWHLEAIEVMEALAKKDPLHNLPDVWGPHVSLGQSYLHMGRYDDAERELRKARDVNVRIFKARPIMENLARLNEVFKRLDKLYLVSGQNDARQKLWQEWHELTKQ